MVGRLSIDRHKVYLSYEKLHLALPYSQLIVDLIDEKVQDDYVVDVNTVDFDLFELATEYKRLIVPEYIKEMDKYKNTDLVVETKKNERSGMIMPHFIKATYV